MSENKNITQLQQIALSAFTPLEAGEYEQSQGWVTYGKGNDYPQHLTNIFLSTPIHGALCKGIADMIAGKGVELPDGIEMDEDDWRGLCLDLKIHGGFYIEIYPRLDGSGIAKIEHLPFERCRLSKENEDCEVPGIWYCREWTKGLRGKNKPAYIPKYKPGMQVDGSCCAWGFIATPGTLYYPKPDYVQGMNYIHLAEQIGEFHINNILNGLFPSFVVNMVDSEESQEKRDGFRMGLEQKIAGAENAGKFIVTWTQDKDARPEFIPFPLTDADKQYQFLAEESRTQILFAHRVTSPLLFGIREAGGGLGSNTDEMETAMALFTAQVVEPFQRVIRRTFNKAGLDIEIVPNDSVVAAKTEPAADGAGTPDVPAGADVSATALNGAQIESLINVVIQAATDVVPIDTAKAIVKAGFPMLTDAQVEEIFRSIVPGSVTPEEVTMSVLRAARMTTKKEPTATDLAAWETRLTERGERFSLDEWEVVDEKEADVLEDIPTDLVHLAANDKSAWGDSGIYALRYRYSTSPAPQRDFCERMVGLAQEGYLYRKEDIDAMSDGGVNGKFAPSGKSSYDIFTWKGGVYCHHKWIRVIFKRKRGPDGKILPRSKTSAMENDQKIVKSPYVPPRGDEGVRPIDTPTKGSLKHTR